MSTSLKTHKKCDLAIEHPKFMCSMVGFCFRNEPFTQNLYNSEIVVRHTVRRLHYHEITVMNTTVVAS